MLKNRIRKLLLAGGVDPSLIGYEYLLTGIYLCYNDRSLLQHATEELYHVVAEEYGTNIANVRRCMRYAVENMEQTDCFWFRKEVVGLIDNRCQLTNSQFIAICVEILKMQEGEENVK